MRHLLSTSLLLLSLATAYAARGVCPSPAFAAPRTLGIRAAAVLPGDFDRDGDLDILISTYVSGPTTAPFLLENGGGGEFAAPRPIAARAGGSLGPLGDFDGDGRLDAVLLRRGSVSLLLGDGRGGFSESADFASFVSSSAAAADVDGDGLLDLVTSGVDPADGKTWTLSFLKGDGLGGFLAPVLQRPPSAGYGSLATGADLDGNGRADLLISFNAFHCESTSAYLGDGLGTFTRAPGPSFAGDGVTLADMNRDGILDVVAGCFAYGNSLEVWLGRGDGTFSQTARRQFDPYTERRLVADFDGDGLDDVLVSAYLGTHFLRGDGKGGLADGLRVFQGEGFRFAGDLDGDGLADLVTQGDDGSLSLRLNVCARPGASEATFLVPFLYRGSGANGSAFTPDLLLVNRGESTANVEATYTATSGSGTSRVTFGLPGGELRAGSLSDLGVSVLTSQGTWGGTLRLRFTGLSSPEHAFAMAGIASVTSGSPDVGGVGLPAILSSDTLSGPAVIGWLRDDERDRTNLVLINAGDVAGADVLLRVTVVSTDPAGPRSITLPDVSLAPGRVAQVDRVLLAQGLGASTGFLRVERIGGGAPYWAYAVVNDNGSSDGSIVPPLAAGRRAGQTVLVVPALVESGAFDSELIVTNTSPSPRRLNLSWTADGLSTPDHTVRLTIGLFPSEQLYVPSFVEWLRERGAEGVGPRGASYAGALYVTVEGGDIEGIFAGARISSAGKAGRYGVFMAASSLAELATEESWVYGLRQARSRPEASVLGARTNLAIVNAGEMPSTFRVDLFDSSGATVESLEEVLVGARGWLQIPSVLFPLFSSSQQSMSAYARIRRVSGAGPFLTYGVLNQGAGPGVGSGDGRILPMRPAPADR